MSACAISDYLINAVSRRQTQSNMADIYRRSMHGRFFDTVPIGAEWQSWFGYRLIYCVDWGNSMNEETQAACGETCRGNATPRKTRKCDGNEVALRVSLL